MAKDITVHKSFSLIEKFSKNDSLAANEKMLLKYLSHKVQNIIWELHSSMMFPIPYCFSAIMAAVSGSIANSKALCTQNGYIVYPSIFMAIIGESGENKSQLIKWFMRPLWTRTAEVLKDYNGELDAYLKEVAKGNFEMDKLIKRPPLLSLHLNLTAKIFAIIVALLFFLGIAGYVWFINTPMYLGDELYKSYTRLNYPNSGAGYSTAYRLVEAGERKQLKDEIRRSEHRERSYIAHRDTLRQLLNDSSIFINRIQYEKSERLIDYTDSTDVIKSAHFRKDESIRITDSPKSSCFTMRGR